MRYGSDYPKIDAHLGLFSFFSAYFAFCVTNAAEFKDVLPVEIKHLVFFLIAFASVVRHPKNAIRALLATIPVAVVYLLGDLPIYAGMVVIFGLSLPMIYLGIDGVIRSKGYFLLMALLLIAFTPFFMAIPSLLVHGLIDDSTFGRPRMLMGFFHPKEAAISFAIPILIYMIRSESRNVIPQLLLMAFLWLVGSRNVTLAISLIWLIVWYPRFTIILIIVSFLVLLGWIIASADSFDVIDVILSERLTVWFSILNADNQLSSLSVESGDRFGADSYFVEVIVIAGYIGFLVLSFYLIGIAMIVKIKNKNSPWPLACFSSLIFGSFFDTGIASTGNMMHVVLWSIALSPLFVRNQNIAHHFEGVRH